MPIARRRRQTAFVPSFKVRYQLMKILVLAGGLSPERNVSLSSGAIDAQENAARNGIENVEFFCGDAAAVAAQLEREGLRPDVVTVDPPRKGLAPDTGERWRALAAMAATALRLMGLLSTMLSSTRPSATAVFL